MARLMMLVLLVVGLTTWNTEGARIRRQSKSWTSGRNACVKGVNNAIIDGTRSLDRCRRHCEVQTGFFCSSIEYHARSFRCVISEASSFTHGLEEPCNDFGWTFSEISGGVFPPYAAALPCFNC
ncbi:unnamed protein product [Meganyctiphanes norvegica]|uniref:Apple domain-containing protein n=1 Tax=Meganyctiphanes norvegica TaxID=48144 RepID=A0AAV2SLP8_MEGNR